MPRPKDVVQRGRVLSDKAPGITNSRYKHKGIFSFNRFSFGPMKRSGSHERWLGGGKVIYMIQIGILYKCLRGNVCAFTVGEDFAQARRNYQARPESGHRRVLAAFAETCQLMFPFRTSISIFYSSSLQIAIQYFWENLDLYKKHSDIVGTRDM
jgi:hypothetical protein